MSFKAAIEEARAVTSPLPGEFTERPPSTIDEEIIKSFEYIDKKLAENNGWMAIMSSKLGEKIFVAVDDRTAEAVERRIKARKEDFVTYTREELWLLLAVEPVISAEGWQEIQKVKRTFGGRVLGGVAYDAVVDVLIKDAEKIR